jgi:hypothetical protein
MTTYRFIADFIPEGQESNTPLFKKGDVIKHDNTTPIIFNPLDVRKDGIYQTITTATNSTVVFIPFTYLESMVENTNIKKSSVPYIVLGILVIGFISYKIIKKYS